MKRMSPLSVLSTAVLTASILLVSTAGHAYHNRQHHMSPTNYKSANLKGEAMPAPCLVPMLKDGVYLGAQVGYDSYRVRQNYGDATTGSFNPVISATGWVGGLFVGYGKYLSDMFYLAGEVFGNYSNASGNFSANALTPDAAYTSRFNSNGNYGLALIPGIKLNDASLGYIRLGWNWATLRARETLNIPGIISASSNRNYTANGFVAGIGIETLLCDNWSVRTEYDYTSYNSFMTAFGTRYSASDNQFLLGLNYHFA